MRAFIALSLVFIAGCGSCDRDDLIDVSCRPGAPAEGVYDNTLPERCDNDIDDNCDGLINETCDCRDGTTIECGSSLGICSIGTATCSSGAWPRCIPAIAPRSETCNALDDDCDGSVDDGIERTCHTACGSGIEVCHMGVWVMCTAPLPELELCNGIDDDCDGRIDNDAITNTSSCAMTTRGECRSGHPECRGGEIACVGAVHPRIETCNALDDDCDGVTDEDLFRPCRTMCGAGVATCVAGAWIDCTARTPTDETCNAHDDDCDGQVDEGCNCNPGAIMTCIDGIPCGTGLAICQPDGVWGPCRFFETTIESCNAHDDDCDGQVDGIRRRCGPIALDQIGACRAGAELCTTGTWGSCMGSIDPVTEVCDGIDNDCNGTIDDGLVLHPAIDMVFAIDVSGSMCSYIAAITSALGMYASEFAMTPHRFGLVTFPTSLATTSYDPDNPMTFVTMPTLVDAQTFINTLAGISCDGWGTEPSYDVVVWLASQMRPWMSAMPQVGWRSNADPYIVVLTDEEAQSSRSTTQQNVAAIVAACQLPGCRAGARVETYVITDPAYTLYWDLIVGNVVRIFSITPPTTQHYVEIFREIFREICR